MVGSIVPYERIEKFIFLIKGHKVMLDRDLARLYEVGTRELNKAVKRNIERFPKDFMFQLTKKELGNLMFQSGTSSWGGTRKLPFAFTEHGILMLSSVLRSKRALQVNIQIMRTFAKLKKMLFSYSKLKRKIDELEQKYNYQFRIVFDTLRKIIEPPEREKRGIGFLRGGENNV